MVSTRGGQAQYPTHQLEGRKAQPLSGFRKGGHAAVQWATCRVRFNTCSEKTTMWLLLPLSDDTSRRLGATGPDAAARDSGFAVQYAAQSVRWRGRCVAYEVALLVFACMTFILFASLPAAAQCPEGQVWDLYGQRCRTGACPEGEVRTADGRCSCPSGYTRQGILCLPSSWIVRPPPPSGCPTNEVRGPNGECVCRSGYRRVESTCVPSLPTSLVAPAPPPWALLRCEYRRNADGTCRCPYGQKLRADERTCVEVRHKCRHCCPEGRIWHAGLRRCVEARRPPRRVQ